MFVDDSGQCRHKGISVKNLMTFGGQHQGIVNVPGCTVFDDSDEFNFICQVSALRLSSIMFLHSSMVPLAAARVLKNVFYNLDA